MIFYIVPKKSDYRVRFGSILWLTGKYKSYGDQFRKGAELARDEINKNGRKELEIIFEDSEAKKEEALKHLRLFKERDNINFIVEIMGSDLALHSIPYITENKMLLLSGVNTSPSFTKLGGKYFFRIIPSDEEAAKQLVRKAIDIFAVKNAALIFATDTWGIGLRSVLESAFRNKDGEFVLIKGIKVDETIYEPIVSELKKRAPDVTFLLLYPKDAALFLKEAGRQNVDARFMGTDNFTGSEVYEVGGEGVEGVLFILPSQSTDDTTNNIYDKFLKLFQNKWGKEKEPELFTKNAYDCVHILYNAFIASNGDVEKAIEFLSKLKYTGVSGEVAFDGDNDVKARDYELWQYHWDPKKKTATSVKFRTLNKDVK